MANFSKLRIYPLQKLFHYFPVNYARQIAICDINKVSKYVQLRMYVCVHYLCVDVYVCADFGYLITTQWEVTFDSFVKYCKLLILPFSINNAAIACLHDVSALDRINRQMFVYSIHVHISKIIISAQTDSNASIVKCLALFVPPDTNVALMY